MTFVQRFGSALNLNIHIHSLLPDGVFVPARQVRDPMAFVPLPAPTTADIEQLTLKIARRLTRVIERICSDEFETRELLEQTLVAMQRALATAVQPPVPQAHLGLEEERPTNTALAAKVAGFSLHAARLVHADDRDELEQLCRYGLRAPFAQERLSLRDDGRVVYHLRRPWPNAQGVTSLVLAPDEFLQRLAALVPVPYTHLVRYHGVFANRSRWRDRLPMPKTSEGDTDADAQGEDAQGDTETTAEAPTEADSRKRRRPVPWAQLLLRVFFVDALTCPRCAIPMHVLAFISDPHVVRKILRHLGLPTETLPLAPAVPRDIEEQLFEDSAEAQARSPP